MHLTAVFGINFNFWFCDSAIEWAGCILPKLSTYNGTSWNNAQQLHTVKFQYHHHSVQSNHKYFVLDNWGAHSPLAMSSQQVKQFPLRYHRLCFELIIQTLKSIIESQKWKYVHYQWWSTWKKWITIIIKQWKHFILKGGKEITLLSATFPTIQKLKLSH